MKLAFGVRQKLVLSVILVVVFAITFLNNLASKNHVHELGSSFSSVYEDRLLVESYIYKLSEILHRKRLMFYSNETGNRLQQQMKEQQQQIATLLTAYDKTKLTSDENTLLKKLKLSFAHIATSEQTWLSHTTESKDPGVHQSKLNAELDLALTHLQGLSAIQLFEAENMNESSKKIVAGSALTSEMGSAMLIVAALITLFLIFSSGVTAKIPLKNPQLN